jgi:hemerythrin-like domain-containing protein
MSTSPETAPLTDTRVMLVLHSFFRREFRLAGGVVRGVPAGDVARAAVVADHLDFLGLALHQHHTTEDVHLWPLLLERVPEELAPIVHLMESQHEQVDHLLAQVATLVPRLRAEAAPDVRDRLADVLDTLYVHLVEHLDAEEERLLPIAARTVTQAEWDAIGEHAEAEAPRSKRSLAFGMFQYDGDPEVVAGMLSRAPAPVRWLVPRLGRRAFRRHATAVHGTPTP